jgi:hypothetical protein
MSQLTPFTPAPPPERPQSYRALSGLAVAGFALAALFAALIAVSTVIALVQGMPLFIWGWWLLLPAAGTVLCLFGRWRIRQSEGTLAGLALTTWGLWLALLVGSGYLTYSFFTGLAIKQQANAFLMTKGEDSGFFVRVQEGDLNRAFLLALPYNYRVGVSAADERQMELIYDKPQPSGGEGLLTMFRNTELVQVIRAAGRDGIRPLGVKDWTYDNKKYKVRRAYRFTTDEWSVDFIVPVEAESERGVRKWNVIFKESERLGEPALTDKGKAMQRVRRGAGEYVLKWAKLPTGKEAAADAPEERTNWDEVRVQVAESGPSAKGVAEQAKKAAHEFFAGRERSAHGVHIPEQPWCPAQRLDDGRIRVTLKFALPLLAKSKEAMPEYVGMGTVQVETKEVVNLPDLPSHPLSWRVAAYQVERVGAVPPQAASKQPPASGGR